MLRSYSSKPAARFANSAGVDVDSAGEPTILGLTPQLLPILEKVLGEPENQLNDETREQVVEMVKFIHGKQPQMVGKYAGLVAAVRG